MGTWTVKDNKGVITTVADAYVPDGSTVGLIRRSTVLSLVAMLVAVLIFEIIQLRAGAWAAAVALSLGLLSVGYVVGLLFAVPKSAGAVPAGIPKDGSGGVGGPGKTMPHLLIVNTNFEQISDWLTKIIVGVGLVQFSQILAFVNGASKRIAAGYVNPLVTQQSAEVLAIAIIIAFPSIGLLLGFFTVRLYIAWAIYATDAQSTGAVDGEVGNVPGVAQDDPEENADQRGGARGGQHDEHDVDP